MGKACNCIVCLDSGYLAIHKDDPNKMVPMSQLTGSQLVDYRLEKCNCKKLKEKQWQAENADKLNKNMQNFQQESLL